MQIYLLLFSLFLVFTTAIALCAPTSLSGQLKQIAKTQGFKILGLEQLGAAPPEPVAGVPLQQIRMLLDKFDYVIVHGPQEKIQRLIIIGPKQPILATQPPPSPTPNVNPSSIVTTNENAGEMTIVTQRDGSHHLVNVILVGTNGQRITQEMLIDTGASITVIPISQAAVLGFNLTQLPSRNMQTLKGSLPVRVGTLPVLEIGNVQVPNLAVAFAEDLGLGKRGLLGMNLLSRYLFILDDSRNELTLIPDPH